jgi:hypothetical protein
MEDEIDSLQRLVISLMPEKYQNLLNSYYGVESLQARYQWANKIADEITELTLPLPSSNSYLNQERALCPLCGDSSSSPYESGFTLPIGLHRHLVGFGNTFQCGVFKAAENLAKDYWHYKYAESDMAEEQRKRDEISSRKTKELLFKIEPDRDPVLIDESVYHDQTRSPQSLKQAEQRLSSLGLVKQTITNSVQYTYVHGQYIVFADPRIEGKIEFRVYKQPKVPTTKKSHGKHRFEYIFYLLDKWKNSLNTKFLDRLPPLA